MNGSKILTFLKNLFDLCLQKIFLTVEKLFDEGKKICDKLCLLKVSLLVGNFHNCGNVSWLWKNYLIVEKFLVFFKIFMTVEKFVKCGKFPGLWKGSLIVETFLDNGMVYCIFFCIWMDRKNSIVYFNAL